MRSSRLLFLSAFAAACLLALRPGREVRKLISLKSFTPPGHGTTPLELQMP